MSQSTTDIIQGQALDGLTIQEFMNLSIPGIMLTETGKIANLAFQEQQKNINLKALGFSKPASYKITQSPGGYDKQEYTITTSWYGPYHSPADIKEHEAPKTLWTVIINGTSQDMPIDLVASEVNKSYIEDGCNHKAIREKINKSFGWHDDPTFSQKLQMVIKARETVYIYTWQVGTKGTVVQYKFPSKFKSCESAGSECISSRFGFFAARNLAYSVGPKM